MSRVVYGACPALLLFICLHPGTAHAQSIAHASYSKVCDAKGRVDNDKLLNALRGDVDANNFFKNGVFDRAKYNAALEVAWPLLTFAGQLEYEKEAYYKVRIGGRPARTIDIPLLVRDRGSHQIECAQFSKAPNPSVQFRADVSKKLAAVGEKLTLRKDIDNLAKGLDEAEPASFSVTDNRISKNTSVQSQFAIATRFAVPNTSLHFVPYVSHEGLFNSKDKSKDIDNLGLGLLAKITNVPVTPWLGTTVAVKGEYLTDSVNDKKVWTGEAMAAPFMAQGADWPVKINERMYSDGILGGSWTRIDLAARYRYGRVEDAGGVATLDDKTNFSRLGYTARFTWKAAGDDAFAGFGFTLGWLYYYNFMLHPATPQDFSKLDAALRYEFNANTGVKIGLERGRNEDSLQQVDRIYASFTIKFGEAVSTTP